MYGRNMRGFAVALVAALVLAFAPAVRAQTYDGPGSCLSVENHRSYSIRIDLNTPSGYGNGHWDYSAGDVAVMSVNGVTVKSPTGQWNLTVTPGPFQPATWRYDSTLNNGYGCNGSWVVSFN